MVEWLAFLLLFCAPLLWFILGDSGRIAAVQEHPKRPGEVFRMVSAEFQTPVSPITPDEVQSGLEAFWSVHDDVPLPVRMGVAIAAAEVAANIVEHSDAPTVRVAMDLSPSRMRVDFIDTGSPVDVDLSSVSMPAELSERGRGLPLAKAALSELKYRREESGNRWSLVSKPFQAAASSALSGAASTSS